MSKKMMLKHFSLAFWLLALVAVGSLTLAVFTRQYAFLWVWLSAEFLIIPIWVMKNYMENL